MTRETFVVFVRCDYSYQFGFGILKMVGPKKQDFRPRINILNGFFFLNPSMSHDSSKSAKIGSRAIEWLLCKKILPLFQNMRERVNR